MFCAPRTAFQIPAPSVFDVNFERHLNVLEPDVVYLNRSLTQEGEASCSLRFMKRCLLSLWSWKETSDLKQFTLFRALRFFFDHYLSENFKNLCFSYYQLVAE